MANNLREAINRINTEKSHKSLQKELVAVLFAEADKIATRMRNDLFEAVLAQIQALPKPKDGKRGEKGERGDVGLSGKDGSPDTGKEIVQKVNSLEIKPEFQIDAKHIKNLPKEKIIERIKSGGGMGNVQHEQFNLTSATTTTTTDFPIAGAGHAVIGFRYNGQMLHWGTGYVVGSNRRTITLQFTPEDGTVADITYIRG